MFAETQTDNRESQTEIQEHCVVSRINHNIASQEECAPNAEPPTMTNTQLEASHHMITEVIVVTVNQATMAVTEELFRKKLKKVLVITLPQLPLRIEI